MFDPLKKPVLRAERGETNLKLRAGKKKFEVNREDGEADEDGDADDQPEQLDGQHRMQQHCKAGREPQLHPLAQRYMSLVLIRSTILCPSLDGS